MNDLKFLQNCRYEITDQIYDTLFQNKQHKLLDIDKIENQYTDSGKGKMYFDIQIEDSTITIELSVSIQDIKETLTLLSKMI